MSSYNNDIAVSNKGGEGSLPPLTSIKEQTTRESKKCHLVRRIKLWGLQ